MWLDRLLHIAPLRLRSLLRARRADEELDEEIREHVERLIEDGSSRGLSPEQARLAALRAMDGIDRHKEACRDVRGVAVLEHAWLDARYGVRALRKNPTFAATATLTLALGIGATAAVFSVVYGVLSRPLPYRDPGALVVVRAVQETANAGSRFDGLFSGAELPDWIARTHAFRSLAVANAHYVVALSTPAGFETVGGAFVSDQFFSLLGEPMAAGRAPAGPYASEVVISERLLQTRFGGDPQALGRQVRINANSFTIVGVMPRDFQLPARDMDVWVPMSFYTNPNPRARSPLTDRRAREFALFGRLDAGVTLVQAQADVTAVARSLSTDYPVSNTGFSATMMPLSAFVNGDVRLPLLVLFASVAVVLLVACLNVASLFVARQSSRSREIATRVALGAPRYRLVTQLLAESVWLAAAGGVAGMLIARWAIAALRWAQPVDLPHLEAIRLDGPVWMFAFVVSAAAALVAAAAPAIQLTYRDAGAGLRIGGAGQGHPRDRRLRAALVVAELAFSLVLLVVAGLLGRSFSRLLHEDIGVKTGGVLVVDTVLTMSRTLSAQEQIARVDEIVDRVGRLPFVQSAGAAVDVPPHGQRSMFTFDSVDPATGVRTQHMLGLVNPTPDFFATLGIPLLRGRLFSEHDVQTSAPVTILSETAARSLFGGEDPIGKPLPYGPRVQASSRPVVVGVVGDVKYQSLDGLAGDVMYRPFEQYPPMGFGFIVARNAPGAHVNAGDIERVIHDVDPEITVGPVRMMDDLVSDALAQPRFRTVLLLAFAALALVLAAIGVYGVVAYSASQRTTEFGVRIALGATPGDVIALVIREGVALAVAGALIGLAGSLAVSRLLTKLLYGVTPADPISFAGAVMCLAAVTIAASYFPARRATGIDPIAALRAE